MPGGEAGPRQCSVGPARRLGRPTGRPAGRPSWQAGRCGAKAGWQAGWQSGRFACWLTLIFACSIPRSWIHNQEIFQSMILGSQGHVSILRSWMLDLRCLISHMLVSICVGSQNSEILDFCPMIVIVMLQGIGSQYGEICRCDLG